MLNHAHKDSHLEDPFEYGNDFGSPDETWLSAQFDRPVMVHRYPADVKAFYMEPDPRLAAGAVRGRAGAGGVWRDRRRLAARVELRAADARIDQHNCRARPSNGISTCAGMAAYRTRVRHGHRAGGSVDLRPGSCARDHPLRPHFAPDLSVKQPSGIRFQWSGFAVQGQQSRPKIRCCALVHCETVEPHFDWFYTYKRENSVGIYSDLLHLFHHFR